ncbi:uncharacterized protein BDR25DRAFT_335130 [Lindgomyces ingoldianus]|uniref:Uncharacterized protein n=1 Tax=Lindgomyces ingoldianus TaxID=673940 RepID=A0ACB6QNU4_9PLEO|nr:uncharacterized protein BDR25DRAFT_335130 [Lindgomyces ingoldianus]KAF2468654.1 hypothetical protein BDR25DRAFT_335130 [Lindgomyces ingoldianus]
MLLLRRRFSRDAAALAWVRRSHMKHVTEFTRPVFPQLVTPMEQLGNVLPKVQQELPLSESLEVALLNMYTEITIFYAYAITFFRSNPNATTSRTAWSMFSTRFNESMSNLQLYSRKVGEIADMMRLPNEIHTAETVEVINSLQKLMISDSGKPCHIIPYGLSLKFYGRSAEEEELKNFLDPRSDGDNLKVAAICGIGGIGKTQLALNYANTSRETFQAIAWIQADTQTKLVQSLSTFASKLGLLKKEGGEDDYQSVQKVRDWLNNSGKAFLLVFDNVEDSRILSQIWPASNKGSIIITSRSLAVAARRAKKIMQLKSFDDDMATGILYDLTGLQPADEADAKAAKEICELIGGLPLAMAHMSSLIQDRGYTYEEFLALYKKHTERIFVKDQSQIDYEHTLNTVWDLSFQSLSQNARVLLEFLSLFDPDMIPERLLIGTRAENLESRLKFLSDDFDFGEVVSELITKTSLICRLTTSKSISMHRLVKFAMLIRVPEDEQTLYLDNAIQLLYHAFPNTWDQRGPQQGHGWRSWETCSAIVPHLSSLMSLQNQYNMKATNTEVFAELIFRIGTYLWENEQPTTAKSFFEYSLTLDLDPNSRICAQAYRILGHINLDVAQPRAALSAYQKALVVREKIEEPDSPAIAEVYDSIACSYSEIGDVTLALEYLAKADAINFVQFNETSARTQAIYSLAYLRGNQPEKALEALNLCWKLQNKTEEEISISQYPKHAGDIVLLARIQYALGRKEEGQRLASKSITIRRGIFGAKGPHVADSIFIVAQMLVAESELLVSARMFREIIDMSRDMVEMRGHLARALWFLASVEDRLDNPSEVERLRREAKVERGRIQGREAPDEDTDEAFMSLVGWMLW